MLVLVSCINPSDASAPLNIAASCADPACGGSLPSGQFKIVDGCSTNGENLHLRRFCASVVVHQTWHHVTADMTIDGGELHALGGLIYDSDATFPAECIFTGQCSTFVRALESAGGFTWRPGFGHGTICEAAPDAGCLCHVRWVDPIVINGIASTDAGVLTVDDGNLVSQFGFCVEGDGLSLRQLAVDGGPLLRFRR